MPTLTLTPDEYDTMMAARRSAEAETERLRQELVAERGKNGDARIKALSASVQWAINVIAFAVANLPPETIRGWPYMSLRGFAEALGELPDFGIGLDEMRTEWKAFAEECRKLELQRERGVTAAQTVASSVDG